MNSYGPFIFKSNTQKIFEEEILFEIASLSVFYFEYFLGTLRLYDKSFEKIQRFVNKFERHLFKVS